MLRLAPIQKELPQHLAVLVSHDEIGSQDVRSAIFSPARILAVAVGAVRVVGFFAALDGCLVPRRTRWKNSGAALRKDDPARRADANSNRENDRDPASSQGISRIL